MTINFWVHKHDLDHLNKLLKKPLPDINDDDYILEVYMQSKNGWLQNNYFQVGISYEDFMRIEGYLDFV
jgi:hypothetical protein